MPLYRRLPKVGRTPKAWEDMMTCISLGDLQAAVDTGRLHPTQTITPKALVDAHLLRRVPKWPGVRLTAEGYDWYSCRLDIALNWCDPEACQIVEAHGGTVQSVYQDKAAYFAMLLPHKWEEGKAPKVELPPPWLWYRYSQDNVRGYLAGQWNLWHEEVAKHSFQWTPELRALEAQMLAEEFKRIEQNEKRQKDEDWMAKTLAELDERDRQREAAGQDAGRTGRKGPPAGGSRGRGG